MASKNAYRKLNDEKLLASLKACVAGERRALVKVLARLAEVDRRELYARKLHYSSLFAFTCKELGYLEDAAWRRVAAARAATKFPILYRRIAQGRIGLKVAAKIGKHLTRDNYKALLARCERINMRDLDLLLAELEPDRPEPRDRVRFLGATAPRPLEPAADAAPLFNAGAQTEPQPRAVPTAGAAGAAGTEPHDEPAEGALPPADETGAQTSAASEPPRVEIRFPAEAGLLRDLERARALLRHKHPSGRFARIFADALSALLDRIDPARRMARRRQRQARGFDAAAQENSAAAGRRVPSRVRDEVWLRDESRCAYIGADGKRCEETEFLEVDHIVPVTLGGRSRESRGLRLLCRPHNALEARRLLGEERMARCFNSNRERGTDANK